MQKLSASAVSLAESVGIHLKRPYAVMVVKPGMFFPQVTKCLRQYATLERAKHYARMRPMKESEQLYIENKETGTIVARRIGDTVR